MYPSPSQSEPSHQHGGRIASLLLMGLVLFLCILYTLVATRRSFNFDEFQVIWESASLLRGKAFYADHIGVHFPLFNIIMAGLVWLTGFKIYTIQIARCVILIMLGVTLFYVYRIGVILWDEGTGLLAVVLTLCTAVFLDKGIEIRHDVGQMVFMVIGGYYGLKYLKMKKRHALLVSGLFCGLALAGTQKAIISIMGLVTGLSFFILRRSDFRDTLKVLGSYALLTVLPLAMVVLFLISFTHEDGWSFIQRTIMVLAPSVIPTMKEVHPFPHSRWDLIQDLLWNNHLFYAMGIGGIIAYLILWFRSNTEKIVLSVWALIGILFYLTCKRPFFQTLLPTIPVMALLVGGLLRDLWRELEPAPFYSRTGWAVPVLALLFIWPLNYLFHRTAYDPYMDRQMTNISFCLMHLKPGDKVLCYTQNQLFFDPVFKITDDACGSLFYDYDVTCFEKGMIDEQCKLVINDYHAAILSPKMKERIKDNYISFQVGDILTPGFKIPNGGPFVKRVWVEGDYHIPTANLNVNGQPVQGNRVHLEKKEYEFHNISDGDVFLSYIFSSSSKNVY